MRKEIYKSKKDLDVWTLVVQGILKQSKLKSLLIILFLKKINEFWMSFLTNFEAIHGQDLRHQTLVLQVGDAWGILFTVGSPTRNWFGRTVQ